MRSIWPDLKDSKGLTLVEVLIFIVIIGIAVGLVMPSFQNFIAKFQLKSSASELKVSLRYARQLAITEKQTRTVLFAFNQNLVATKYAIIKDAFTPPIRQVELPSGIKITGCNFADKSVKFGTGGLPSGSIGGTITMEDKYNNELYIIVASTGRVRIDDRPPDSWFEKP